MSSYAPGPAVHVTDMGRQATLRRMQVEAWLDRAARLRPDHPAVNAMTYAELDAAANADVLAGARVGIALPAGEDFVVALHAVWRAAAVAVPIDLRLTDAERPA